MRKYALWSFGAYVVMIAPAQAYIGPGMGAGAIAVTLGVIGSIFLAIFAVLYYPIKRMLKKNKDKKKQPTVEKS